MSILFKEKAKKIVTAVITVLTLLFLTLCVFAQCKGQEFSIISNLNIEAIRTSKIGIICLILSILFFLTFPISLAQIIFSLFKKKEYRIFLAFNIIITTLIFVFGNVLDLFTPIHNLYLLLDYGLYVLFFIYNAICYFIEAKNNPDMPRIDLTRITILIIDFISVLIIFACFFLPFAYLVTNNIDPETNKNIVQVIWPLKVFFAEKFFNEDLILLGVIFLGFFICGILLLKAINNFSNETFYKKSKNLVYVSFAMSFIYFIGGIVFYFLIPKIYHVPGQVISYIPAVISFVLTMIFAYFYARVKDRKKDETKEVKKKKRRRRAEALIYSFIFFGLTLGTLFFNILKVEVSTSMSYGDIPLGSGQDVYIINGLDVLMNYQKYQVNGKGIETLAYFLYLFATLSLLLVLINTFACLGKSKLYARFFLTNAIVDCLIIALIGLFGKYYEIAQTINEDNIKAILQSYGFVGTLEYNYKVSSDAIYMLFAALFILLIVFLRAPYTKLKADDGQETLILGRQDENKEDNKEETKEEEQKQEEQQEEVKEEKKEEENKEELPPLEEEEEVEVIPTFDSCPAFSEIDSQLPLYIKTLEEKKKHTFENLTLPNLVRFIIDYARESRLHLFYSYEDMAYFIAGLGSSRLSILQGMSGTGKTSLPKIFIEAICGNINIIEIESSWRDKNELLGYYNEFSKIYSPRKFTQALYKAKLNSEETTFIILDEMNLSRIEYYFSDFLSLMENEEDKREIRLINTKIYNCHDGIRDSYLGLKDDHTIMIPKNIWFIGTANRDESTFEISDKVYDRAITMNFNKRAAKQVINDQPLTPLYVSYEALQNLFNEALNSFNFDIDNSLVVQEVERILAPYNISFGNRIYRQMEKFIKIYCCCFDNPASILDDALERILLDKVVYKLETKNIENKEHLKDEFERLKLYRIKEFVEKLNED